MLPTQMKAVIFEQYGDADVLKYTDFRVPKLELGEALLLGKGEAGRLLAPARWAKSSLVNPLTLPILNRHSAEPRRYHRRASRPEAEFPLPVVS